MTSRHMLQWRHNEVTIRISWSRKYVTKMAPPLTNSPTARGETTPTANVGNISRSLKMVYAPKELQSSRENYHQPRDLGSVTWCFQTKNHVVKPCVQENRSQHLGLWPFWKTQPGDRMWYPKSSPRPTLVLSVYCLGYRKGTYFQLTVAFIKEVQLARTPVRGPPHGHHHTWHLLWW